MLFKKVGQQLKPKGIFCIYGPFNYQGQFTSASNKAFDLSLKSRFPHMGIRDFEAIEALAEQSHMTLLDDIAMPANNRTLVWQKCQ